MNVRRVVFLLPILLLVPILAFAKTVVDTSAAPLDEYFGSQKMSALGIRMRIDDLARRYHAHLLGDADTLHDAVLVEDSYHAWARRYPRDRWLAPTAFHLEQLYAEVQLPEARTDATTMLHFIAGTFADTKFAHLSRLRLVQGFPPLGAPSVVSSASPAAPSPESPAPPAPPSALASEAPTPGMPSATPSTAASANP